MPLDCFHPAVAAWFRATFAEPTPAQDEAWPAIRSGRHALIAAPTGSGKTFAAFLAAIDDLVRRGIKSPLADETAIVYVSPLKALSNDIRINLEAPLAGIRAELERLGLPDVEIRTIVRTGDTPQAERALMRKRPPHIVVTTPESLYILLGSESGRRMLATTRSVIVDEIHALAPNKRGSHLALSLARLEALCERRLVRIGLSATQKPLETVARFLIGAPSGGFGAGPVSFPAPGIEPAANPSGASRGRENEHDCAIVDVGYGRRRELHIELPAAPLEAVMSADAWQQVYTRLAELAESHRTTLVFVNTRRMAERTARHLSERLGKERVAAHHGSLAKEARLDAEQRLKRGELRVLVATASLELGIDIGDVDLVCQLASPHSIAAFLQRVGRSGHAVGATPRGCLFPQSRDDLVECAALLDSVRRGELDTLTLIKAPLDVLAQHLVAEIACREWSEQALFEMVRSAWPYAHLEHDTFMHVVRMLADGYTTRFGPRSAYVHRDAVNGNLRARRGARLTAITSGGVIPDNADYDVVLEPAAQMIGTVNEDFAVESIAGDIFQLGNMSYRILRVERSRVRVEDAHGAPPTIPFWLGEAPGRSDELSSAVSRLRGEISRRLPVPVHGAQPCGAAQAWLTDEVGLDESAARQIVEYLGAAKAALGVLPTRREIAIERFFDESGGTQLVIHTPLGSRINRAWGLALRKRFCRKFNFELQAAATEDAIVLSLSTSHSFPLEDVARYLNSSSVCEVLIQALLDAPMFGVRWRWNASTALALPRFTGGRKVPAQLQRMKAEDLLATVFPDQVACAENLVGEREIPDHPLVAQTVHDCLHEAMDVDGLVDLLRALECGDARVVARDLTEPSPLAAEVLGARPYAYLDDAPLEERRTQAVSGRRWVDAATAADFGRLDPGAIAAVRDEAWPGATNADELHDALMAVAFLGEDEVHANPVWSDLLDQLAAQRRVTSIDACATPGALRRLWIPAERLPQFCALFPSADGQPPIAAPAEYASQTWTREEALLDILRARLTGLGPATADALARSLGVAIADVDVELLRLESEGYVMRGQFTAAGRALEWCERHLLARIHRYTVGRLRREIEPVEPRDFMRFLFEWQHVAPGSRVSGPDALAGVVAQLEGYEAPAAAWESELLPARIEGYEPSWLDDLCLAGRLVWTRLRGATDDPTRGRSAGPVRATPIVLLLRRHLAQWTALGRRAGATPSTLSSRAQAVVEQLVHGGAAFFDELVATTGLLRTELEDALGELVATGIVNADSFAGLRALLVPAARRAARRRGRRRALFGIADAGRWGLVRRRDDAPAQSGDSQRPRIAHETLELVAWTLLRRYGVVCWRVIAREAAWLPPWRELVRVLQRLEARGEIRGGRFIAGLSGEQFALPDAIGLLRKTRQTSYEGILVSVCGADPLNLVGNVVAGAHVPTLTGSRVLYRDGIPIATLVGSAVTLLEPIDPALEWTARKALLRRTDSAKPTEACAHAASDAV
ncbi:MAG: DEAD/DEAH box helicase [Rhodanobacteraceae bacterium]